MTGSASDTAVLTAGTNGTLSIVTTDAAAAAANIQITADGTVDIDSAGVLTLDSGAAINIEPATGSAILLDGTISIDAGVVTGATSITSTAFVGGLTGNVTGNASGTAATVTGGTQASITSTANLVTVGTIGTGVWQGTAIASGYIAADAITGAKIADDAINSEHYAAASIDNEHLADDAVGADELAANAVVTASIVAGSVTVTELADNSVTSAKIVNGTIVTADIANNAILTQHIDDNQITGDQIADNLVLSGTGAIRMPDGTTAQRPSAAAGMFRYNTTTSKFEGYTDSWGDIGGGGSNTFTRDAFTGDGLDVTFTLSQSGISENNLLVFIEGVFQDQDAYSVSGTTLTFGTAPVNGRGIIAYSVASAVSGSNLNQTSASGDGLETQFTMGTSPVSENNTQVFIDGVYQHKNTYSTSGTTLTFSAAPPNGTAIEIMIFTQTDVNVPTDDTIDTAHLKASAITTAKIADNAVTAAKIPDNVLTATMLPDNVILATHIPNATNLTLGTVTANLTGNVTGNTSGTALTVTQAAQTAITSVGTLTGLTVAGEVSMTTLDIGGTNVTSTAAELNYVDGVTSAVQTQMDTKASTGKAIAMAMVFG